MPKFQVEQDGQKYSVDADNEQHAWEGVQQMISASQVHPDNHGMGTRAQREPDTMVTQGGQQVNTIPYATSMADAIHQNSAGDAEAEGMLSVIPGFDQTGSGIDSALSKIGIYGPGVTGPISQQDRLSQVRGAADANREMHPYARALGNVEGIAGTALVAPAVAPEALGTIGSGIATGAVYGGGSAAIDQDGSLADKAKAGLIGLGVGGATGGLLGAAAASIGGLARAGQRMFPTVGPGADARAAAQRLVDAGHLPQQPPAVITADSPGAQRAGNFVQGSVFGTPLAKAVTQSKEDLGKAVQSAGGMIGDAAPASIAGGNLRTTLGDAVDQTVQGGEANLDRSAANTAMSVGQPKDPSWVGGDLRTGINTSLQNQVQQGDAALQGEISQAIRNVGAPSETAAMGSNLHDALVDNARNISGQRIGAESNALDTMVHPDAVVPGDVVLGPLRQSAGSIISARQASGKDDIGAALSEVAGLLRRPNVTIAGLRRARSDIGDVIDGRVAAPTNYKRGEYKQVYRALTEGIQNGYEHVGGAPAVAQWRQFNTVSSNVMGTNQALARKLLGEGKSDEQVFHTLLGAAQDGGQANVDLLNQVRSVIPPEQWNNFAASAAQRMGRDANGAYSPEVFGQNYSKLSQAGRDTLFTPAQQLTFRTAIANGARHTANVNRATQFTNRVAGTGKSDEGIYSSALSAAQGGGKANARVLLQMRSAVPANDWNNLGASIINRMGRDNNGVYSAEKFIKDHGNLSDIGKNILFSPQNRLKVDGLLSEAQQHLQSITPMQALSQKLLGPGKSDENLFHALVGAASSKSQGDLKLLMQAKNSMPAKDWGDFVASSIHNLGRGSDNVFSPDIFLTEYGKLSDAGKNVMFSSAHRKAIEDIAETARQFRDYGKMANHSNSANAGSIAGFVVGALRAPFKTLGLALGANGVARLMARPATAQGMANWSNAYARFAQNATRRSARSLSFATKVFALSVADSLGDKSKAKDIEQKLLQAQ